MRKHLISNGKKLFVSGFLSSQEMQRFNGNQKKTIFKISYLFRPRQGVPIKKYQTIRYFMHLKSASCFKCYQFSKIIQIQCYSHLCTEQLIYLSAARQHRDSSCSVNNSEWHSTLTQKNICWKKKTLSKKVRQLRLPKPVHTIICISTISIWSKKKNVSSEMS